jgi:hypothetical protein
MDLARAKGISLAEASSALTTIEAGRARGLATLGINTKDYATTAERLAAVEKAVGGQAEAYANTTGGKVVAAQVKALEAQEKLGKGLAEMEAVILPAVADAVESLAGKVDDLLTTSFDKGATSAKDLADSIHFLYGQQIPLGITTIQLNASLADQVQGQVEAALATGKTADSEHMLGIAMRDGAKAAGDMAGSTGDLTAATLDLNPALTSTQRAAEKLTGAYSDLEDAMFGSQIRAGDVAQAQQDLADVMRDEPQKHAGQEWVIWNGRMAEAKKRLFELQQQEAEAKGPQALYDWLLKQQAGLSKADQKAQAYMLSLRALALLSSNLPPVNFVQNYMGRLPSSIGPQRFAEGGIVKASPGGTLALIGEGGQDEAVVPIGKGSTAGRLVGGGGGQTNLHFHFPNAIGMTPGGAELVARLVEPIITRSQQKRGLFGAGAR